MSEMESRKRKRQIMSNIVMHSINKILQERPESCRDSVLQGEAYMQELLQGHNGRFNEIFGMTKQTFGSLLHVLRTNNLKVSPYLSGEQKLGIFLSILRGASNRNAQENFQHSGDTISRVVHEVGDLICNLRNFFLVPPSAERVPVQILNDPRRYPYFRNCIGAIDGSHVPCVPPVEDRHVFRSRKGDLTQNVLAIVNFDTTFSVVIAGWEGSAPDAQILGQALDDGVIPLFPGKYYLADAGFGLTAHFLTPYRGVRYHLREWALGNRRPQDAKELFNLRHSSLRNVVERTFGIVKQRFKILKQMPSYEFPFQCSLVLAACYLHNFVVTNHDRFQVGDDDIALVEDNGEVQGPQEELNADANPVAFRNQIADAMFAAFH